LAINTSEDHNNIYEQLTTHEGDTKKTWQEVFDHTVEKLVEIGEPAVDILIELLGRRPNGWHFVHRDAIKALTQIGDKRAAKSIIKILKSEDNHPYNRCLALDALGEIGGKEVIDAMIKILEDEDYEYNSKASGSSRFFKASSTRVRSSHRIAVKILRRILSKSLKNDDTNENLRKFLESDDPAIIRMGASMLKGLLEK